jgi:hypothetical protein
MLASRQTGIKPDENGVALGGADGAPYVFTNRKSTTATIPWVMTPNPLRTAKLRAPYSQARCFAAESQMDDMAAAAACRCRRVPHALSDRRATISVSRGTAGGQRKRAKWQSRGAALSGPRRHAAVADGRALPSPAWPAPSSRKSRTSSRQVDRQGQREAGDRRARLRDHRQPGRAEESD